MGYQNKLLSFGRAFHACFLSVHMSAVVLCTCTHAQEALGGLSYSRIQEFYKAYPEYFVVTPCPPVLPGGAQITWGMSVALSPAAAAKFVPMVQRLASGGIAASQVAWSR